MIIQLWNLYTNNDSVQINNSVVHQDLIQKLPSSPDLGISEEIEYEMQPCYVNNSNRNRSSDAR